jgi:hypothetical protein
MNGYGSREFDGVDDIISLGSPAILDDVNTFTVLAWIYADSVGEVNGRTWCCESSPGSAGFRRILFDATGKLWGDVDCATTDAASYTSDISLVTWQFIAMTYDNVGDRKVRLYRGSPAALIAECSYVAQTAGVGAIVSDAAVNKYIGNTGDTTRTFDGKTAQFMWFNRVLVLNEMIGIQYGRLISNGLISYLPLWGTG